MRRALAAPFALALALAACAAPQAELPRDVLLRMQSEARGEIYDRENDLAIARNRIDEAHLRGEAVRQQLAELEERGERMRARLGKGKGAGGPERAARIGKQLEAQRDYLESQLKHLAARQEVAEAQASVARARLEQTRQRELVRTGRALARSMKPFDGAVESLDKRVHTFERREGDLRMETEKTYERWKASQEEYARATGDWDSAVWTD